MTSSVRDKTAILAHERRRHTDSPSLWIFAAITSVSLHLLLFFWFMRSSNGFKPWFPQQGETGVPIELIEISPIETSAETVSPKSSISAQESPSTSAPEIAAPTTSSNEDTEAINSDASLLSESELKSESTTESKVKPSQLSKSEGEGKVETSQANTQNLLEKTVSTPAFQPKPTPTIAADDLPWNRREEVVLEQGQPLPTDLPSIPSELPKVSEIEQGKIADTAEEIEPTPSEKIADNPGKKGLRVTFTPFNKTEIAQLVEEGRLTPDGLPDVLAIHRGSNTKNLDSSYIFSDSQFEPVKLLASLVIDHNGNLEEAVVLEIEPVSLPSKKSLYEQIVNDIFKNDRFLPAQNKDGTKPELSNLFLQITIEPVSINAPTD
ncbi:hypothetical protein [Umezakia ovalisporum]|uniref:TonB C-terminal domain-containing protein n=1 Tax=Umezakia ovalisporum FSS-43 TaxID=2740520 RepID=A0ABT6K3R2_9CYAN|nr:hypothetical protein [Umezakia ovalisporum]MDH6057014.1 hypothetical protein [Umezakia ovalisporum FSS-43]MDH6068464.1 hypothetical protein [Umezakia ovalisporum APH033B]MDH6071205.1 hypothetical protein [Umezakia ovalisporum CobakiLakeA]MDH6082008.1 hypothetical protein [Umezakia ovalisporum FSS-44]MDH6095239.1 hypothetical protein [Umezakia ovalisporum CobakiLakeB]